jgi:hypothetical protein
VDTDIAVCFNSAWLPYVIGSLSQLVLPTTWDTDDNDTLLLQLQRAQLLIAMFTTPCGESAMFNVRQNEEAPCTLDKTIDGGETWEAWANMQLCPPRLRTDKGKMQWFDGENWQDLPDGGDERVDGSSEPQWTDPPSGETGNCLAAENIVASYVTMLTQTKSGLEATLAVSSIVTAVSGYIGAQTLFPPALFLLNLSIAIDTLAALGIGQIDDFLESEDIDLLKCIINCHASSDGAFTAAEFDAIKDDVDLQLSVLQKPIVSYWLDSYGPVGLTRAAAANGILDGDCGDCDCDGWSHTWLFDVEQGPFIEAVAVTDVQTHTTYVTDSYWQQGCYGTGLGGSNQDSSIYIQFEMPVNTHLNSAYMKFDRVDSGFNDGGVGGDFVAKNWSPGGAGASFGGTSGVGTGTDIERTYAPSGGMAFAEGDKLVINVSDGYLIARGNCDSLSGGSAHLKVLTLSGDGLDPFE